MDGRAKIICAVGLFLAGYIFYTSSLLQPYYAAEFALSSLQIGMAQAAVPVGSVLGAMFAGWLGDFFGRHRILVYTFLSISIFGLVSILIYNFPSLFMFRLVNGALAGMLYPLCAAYLTEMNAENNLARPTAIMMFVNCLAAPAGCCAAMLLSNFCDGPMLWRLLSLCHVVPAFLAYCYMKRLPESQKWLAVKTRSVNKFSALMQPGCKLMTLCLGGAWFLMDVAYYGINFFVPYLLQIMAVKNGSFYISLFFSLGAATAVMVVNRVNIYKLQKCGFLLASVSLFILSTHYWGMQQPYIIIGLFILFNFALNIGPCVTTYLLSATSYPVEMRASSHGILSAIAKFGSVLGVLFLPVMQEAFGVELVIFFMAVVLFAAYLLSLALEKIMLSENYNVAEENLVYEIH